MTRAIVVLGVTAFLFIFAAGCSGSSNTPPNPVADDTLTEFRLGNAVFDPVGTNIFAFGKENRMSFKFSKPFNPKTFFETMSTKILVENRTQGWENVLTTAELMFNGAISLQDYGDGSEVIYSANHPFNYLRIPNGSSSFVRYPIAPGDELLIKVDYVTAKYEDNSSFLLWDNNFHAYCSREPYERPVYKDDINTDGLIESIKFGSYVITDEMVNLIPIATIGDITVDFKSQLNPNIFADIVNFKIIINNLSQHKSFVLGRLEMANNGTILMSDYVRGIVRYQMNHSMRYLVDGYVIYGTDDDLKEYLGSAYASDSYGYSVEAPLIEPGDLVEVQIDFFQGEDILENPFLFEQKKFTLFYLGS
jgi:hypothetical protein